MRESRISLDGASRLSTEEASRISLDGAWDFLHIADDRLTGPADVRQSAVPRPWQPRFAVLRMRAGIGM